MDNNYKNIKDLYTPFLKRFEENEKDTSLSLPERVLKTLSLIIETASYANKILDNGTNQESVQCVANKKSTPKSTEEPLTIMFYQLQATPTTHIGAYYNGKRLDFFPRDVSPLPEKQKQLTLRSAATVARVMSGRSVPERHLDGFVPQNLNTVECFNIYPSQLGISKKDLTNAIEEVRRKSTQYNLYDNNCAHQIIMALEMCKPGCTSSVEVALPANLKNWAQKNGYQIPPELAPLNNDKRDVTILLKWLENPNAMYYELVSKNKTLTKAQKKIIKARYKIAKSKPTILIEHINNIIQKNKRKGYDKLNALIYSTIDKTHIAKKKIIKSNLIQHYEKKSVPNHVVQMFRLFTRSAQ